MSATSTDTAAPTRRARSALPRPSFLAATMTVFGKDLRIELRTREIVMTTGFFGVLVALMASLAFTTGSNLTLRIAPGTIWLSIAFSSVLALGRSWQREREEGAFTGLLVAPVPRPAIFLGKMLGIWCFVTVVELVVVPVVALVLHVDLLKYGPSLALVLLIGTIGVAATGTLFGAMTVRTRARDLVLATVLFPLLSPALLSGVVATRELLGGASFDEVTDYLVLLGTFDAVALAGGLGLFGSLVDEGS
jgi:heme exporter protein B